MIYNDFLKSEPYEGPNFSNEHEQILDKHTTKKLKC